MFRREMINNRHEASICDKEAHFVLLILVQADPDKLTSS
jgi:hypothetical protein